MGIIANDSNFEKEVIERSRKLPVVVDFWAAWCFPCSMLAPALEKIAKEYDGKFVLAKLNVDENPAASSRYGISSIPAVKMFKGGKIAAEFAGAIPEGSVREWLKRNL